ncbi:MAG: hypothetical protein WDM96_02660 [Lacunisphaera sp.]
MSAAQAAAYRSCCAKISGTPSLNAAAMKNENIGPFARVNWL